MTSDEQFMHLAIDQAKLAMDHRDVPVGAVLVDHDGEVVASDHNRREELSDPAAHAEMLVLSARSRQLSNWRLDGHTLYVTLEPCVMCAGGISWSRIDRVVYGAPDFKAGAALSLYNVLGDTRLNHQSEITDRVLEAECSSIITEFFAAKRTE
jgi:tRNA(adenine34) deaminase